MSDPTKRLATAAQTAFVSPTALASQRLGSRLSPRPLSPASSSDVSATGSRRSPSLRTGPDQAHIFDQMGAANQVVLKKSKTSSQSNSRVASPVNSMGSKSTLDLRNNDNSFHVLASLLVEFFHSKLMGDCLHLRFEDREHVERLLPETARASFCQAVGHRLERTPSVPTTPVQFLTLQCQELGLDRLEAASNPILAVMGLSTPGQQATVPYVSLLDTSSFHSAGSFKKSETTKQPPASVSYTAPPPVPQQPVQQPVAPQSAAPPRTGGARSISPLDTPSLGAMTATTEDDLARQQLLAELREASNFMAASVNPETTQFWKTQVLQLQARLRTLHGASSPPASPLQVLETNRRLVNQHQQQQQQQQTREQHQQQQYVPPPASVTVPTDRVVASPQSQHAAPLQQPSLEEEQDMYHQQHQQQQDDDQSYSAPSMVDVVAPADLPGGYHFEAEIEGQRFLATVPSGGCKEGETFSCAWRELDSVATDVPVGYWKDGPFDVWSLGVCHPVIWNALLAPLFVLGQIQTRIKLDFLGRPQLGPSKTNISNRTMMASVMAFWFLMNALMFGAYNLKWYRRMELSVADLAAFALVNFTMYGFVVFVAQSTRSTLRERFLIRETRCYDLEDLCCATWCLPCTVSQMARHTAHYEAYEAVCCSKTGLPDGVSMQQAPAQAPQYVV